MNIDAPVETICREQRNKEGILINIETPPMNRLSTGSSSHSKAANVLKSIRKLN